MSGTVSVIIPTYNREKYILNAVKSVLNQTYQNLECIVIDDASTDGTEEILSNIEDERFVYYSLKENRGQAVARNKGIELAKGQYIAFNDSDDVWEPDKLEKQMPVLLNDKTVAMVFCRYILLDRKDNILLRCPAEETIKEIIDRQDLFEILLKGNFIGTPTMVMRREVLQELGGFKEQLRAIEDYELVLRLAEKNNIAFINETLVKAFRYDGSVSTKAENILEAELFLLEEFPEKELREIKEGIFSGIAQLKDSYTRQLFKEKLKNRIVEKDELLEMLISGKRNELLSKYRNDILFRLEENGVEKIKKYIEDNGVEYIAIYGAGKMGKVIRKRLHEEGIEIVTFIDRAAKSNDNAVINIKEIPPEIELIIASIHECLYDREEIMKYSRAEIKNLQDLLKYEKREKLL